MEGGRGGYDVYGVEKPMSGGISVGDGGAYARDETGEASSDGEGGSGMYGAKKPGGLGSFS